MGAALPSLDLSCVFVVTVHSQWTTKQQQQQQQPPLPSFFFRVFIGGPYIYNKFRKIDCYHLSICLY